MKIIMMKMRRLIKVMKKLNNEVHNDLKLIENIDNNMKKPLTSHQE